jgi:coniferyl-aldehyde dehydrogenase
MAAVAAPPETSLDALIASQRRAFDADPPDYDARIGALDTLRDMLRAHESEFVDAVSEDFGGRAREETLLLELLPLREEIRNARRHLRKWMRPRAVRPTWFLLPARARVMYQPLGVVGVIGAWNYQLLLTLSPLVGALAAGNHVMVKPSEITPRTADLAARVLAERFPARYVAAVTGGPDVAAAFAALPFDHLVFTGSTRVGKLVMRAASEHLTQVTLELGGKSPAIVHAEAPLERAVERIMMGKLYNAGQTCVAPDYVLVPRPSLGAFRAAAARFTAERFPRLVDTRDYTRIVNEAHWQRVAGYVAEARARGVEVAEVNPAGERCTAENRVLPPTLLVDPPEDLAVMQEEIFGPVLPLVPYDSLDDAIAYVNARPRPLALYYFDDDARRVERVLERTVSGGVTVNDVVYHLGQDNLPFGGVGPSGLGHYHGFDGFERFSKKKGVMLQSRWSPLALVRPPYTARTRALIARLMKF